MYRDFTPGSETTTVVPILKRAKKTPEAPDSAKPTERVVVPTADGAGD